MTTDTNQPWIVRANYVFGEGNAAINELDELVHGELLPPYGEMSHAIGNQPLETTLEWRVGSIEDGRTAVSRLKGMRGVRDARLARFRQERILDPSEYAIRASDARAGRAACVACAARIAPTPTTIFALDGVRKGNEATLRCDVCGLAMDWIILPEL